MDSDESDVYSEGNPKIYSDSDWEEESENVDNDDDYDDTSLHRRRGLQLRHQDGRPEAEQLLVSLSHHRRLSRVRKLSKGGMEATA
ncbi:hypothetical protein ACP4OV_027210 [Aristida adscensionis]